MASPHLPAHGVRRPADGSMIGRPTPAERPCAVLCDLDGVVWLAHVPIPGAVQAIAEMRRRGHRVLFVTNNSAFRVADHEAALAGLGIPADGDVLSSAMACALLLGPDDRVLVLGGPGIVEAVEQRGAVAVAVGSDEPVDAVVVGFHRSFGYESMREAASAVRRGARLIGTNDDATYPTPAGPVPGGGAILAGVATAAGVDPVVAGKPFEPMAVLVRSVVGDEAARGAVMVGDRPSTDGLFARRLGCRFALVLSGVTLSAEGVEPAPDLVAPDLAGIAAVLDP